MEPSPLIPAVAGRRFLPQIAVNGLLAVVYYASARLGLLVAVTHPVVSSIWPPTGVALAAVLLMGTRVWPGIAVGALVLNWTSGVPWPGALGITAGNTLEAVAAGHLLGRFPGFHPSLTRLRDIVVLVTVGAPFGTIISATIGVLSLQAVGLTAPSTGWEHWIVWWSGDVMGVLLVAPLILTWAHVRRERRWPTALLVSAATVLLVMGPFSSTYALFPVVIWSALRLGPRGSSAIVMLVTVLTVWQTIAAVGPFAEGPDPTRNLISLQLFLAVLSLTGMILAAVTAERSSATRLLQDAEQRFRTLVEGVRDYAILWLDPDGRVASWNVGAQRLYGYTRAEIIGQPASALYPREYLAAGKPDDTFRGALSLERWDTEGWRVRKDGTRFWADVTLSAVRDPAGTLLGFAKLTRDLTERRSAQERLRREADFVHALQRVAVAANQGGDVTETLQVAVNEVCRVSGWPVGHVYRVASDDPNMLQPTTIWHEDEPARNTAFRVFTEGTSYPSGTGLAGQVHATRQPVWVVDITEGDAFTRAEAAKTSGLRAAFGVPILVGDEVAGVLEFFAREPIAPDQPFLDVMAHIGTQVGRVIERERATSVVAHSRARLRELAARIESTREGERLRIAREIYDELGQALTALHMDLGWLKTRVQDSSPGVVEKLDDMVAVLTATGDSVHRLATELRPRVFDESGLPAAIRWQVNEFQARTGVPCELDLEAEQPETLDVARAVAAFRILQEALTNVARHSGATRVQVRFRLSQDTLRLTVEDDGKGITEETLRHAPSLGLLGIQERASNLGGEVSIAGRPGLGAIVSLTLPRA